MKRTDADKLYNANWARGFTSREAMMQQIKDLATLGAYEMCVYFDSKAQYDAEFAYLREQEYTVEHQNGGPDLIIQISWG